MVTPVIKIKVRWSDIDANRHLANSSYVNYSSSARVERLNSLEISMEEIAKQGIGPVVFHENFSFFKEVCQGQSIYISAEITGLSKDATLFEFTHNFYDESGINLCRSYMIGTWLDYKTRKRVLTLPKKWKDILFLSANPNFKTLSMVDVKKLPHRALNIDTKNFSLI